MYRWLSSGTHRLAEWETDLSSQTGASQAGILLGSNDDIPAFRWVEKESGKVVACSSPADCAEVERRHATGDGLLIDEGASRGNLFSGEADAVILTVSRMSAEKRSNPGYRAFFANGFNVTRLLVLFAWEFVLERIAAIQQSRRRIEPRGRRTTQIRAAASRAVRGRARPDRLRRTDRHDAGAAGGVRDAVELRRGRSPLRPGARRHPRGAAQARSALRPHRPSPPVRASPVQAGGAVRSRPDPGRNLQAAQRLRPVRAGRALDRTRNRDPHRPGRRERRRRSVTRSTRPRAPIRTTSAATSAATASASSRWWRSGRGTSA